MAIKGKRKSKRRGVAAAPKPVYVKPKRPLLARRGFQIGVLVFIAVVALVSVATALVVQHNNNKDEAQRAEEASIVRRFGGQVDDAIADVAQQISTSYQAFPTFASDVADFKSGKLSASDALDKATKYSTDAGKASTAVNQIGADAMVAGHDDLSSLADAQSLIANALQLYQQAGDAFKLAAKATGDDRDALIEHTQSLLAIATHQFSQGYQVLVNERARFGLVNPAPAAGVPPSA